MWLIKNITNKSFFAGWHEGKMLTADSKNFASHYSTWDSAAAELKNLVGAWEIVPKDKA